MSNECSSCKGYVYELKVVYHHEVEDRIGKTKVLSARYYFLKDALDALVLFESSCGNVCVIEGVSVVPVCCGCDDSL